MCSSQAVISSRFCQFAAIYVIFVTGLNIFMGYAGQVSFGHNAFAAISGYTSAVLTANLRMGAASRQVRSAFAARSLAR